VCRAAARLVLVGAGGSVGAPSAALSGGGMADGPAVGSAAARRHDLASSRASERPVLEDGGGPPSVVAALGGLAPTDVSLLAAVSVAMILLAVTALAGYALTGAHAASRRRRGVIDEARAGRFGPGRRGDAAAVVVLVVASLAFWAAVTLWLVASSG
jgi:hypothetical protein